MRSSRYRRLRRQRLDLDDREDGAKLARLADLGGEKLGFEADRGGGGLLPGREDGIDVDLLDSRWQREAEARPVGRRIVLCEGDPGKAAREGEIAGEGRNGTGDLHGEPQPLA